MDNCIVSFSVWSVYVHISDEKRISSKIKIPSVRISEKIELAMYRSKSAKEFDQKFE